MGELTWNCAIIWMIGDGIVPPTEGACDEESAFTFDLRLLPPFCCPYMCEVYDRFRFRFRFGFFYWEWVNASRFITADT